MKATARIFLAEASDGGLAEPMPLESGSENTLVDLHLVGHGRVVKVLPS